MKLKKDVLSEIIFYADGVYQPYNQGNYNAILWTSNHLWVVFSGIVLIRIEHIHPRLMLNASKDWLSYNFKLDRQLTDRDFSMSYNFSYQIR